jgi:hypothetical protein
MDNKFFAAHACSKNAVVALDSWQILGGLFLCVLFGT